MSLIDNMMCDCCIVEKVRQSDGAGGFITTWQDGATIKAAITYNSSMESRIAERQGVTSTYNVTTYQSCQLDYHDVIKRLSDGAIFRITSNAQDKLSPAVSTLDIARATAERWELPT